MSLIYVVRGCGSRRLFRPREWGDKSGPGVRAAARHDPAAPGPGIADFPLQFYCEPRTEREIEKVCYKNGPRGGRISCPKQLPDTADPASGQIYMMR